MTGLCAICVCDGEVRREILDGKLVRVCVRCSSEHPIHGGYSFGDSSRDQRQAAAASSAGSPGCRRKGGG